MTYPKINLSCVANLFSRQMHFEKAGDIENGHKHPFDHLTLLANGSLKIVVDNKVTIFKAPHMIYIAKDKIHELTALEDNTVAFCIHALRDGDRVEDILDPETIPKGVNPLKAGIAKPLTCG
jgi:quercetin dioxygenase-like cupin family protein